MKLRLVLFSMLVAVMAAACSTSAAAGSPAPSGDPNQAATTQATRFFDLLKAHDVAGLEGFLSPAFQLARADGSGAGKTDYLGNLAVVNNYELTDFSATQTGNVLVARYLADVEGTVNGQPYTPGPAPRISVFVWNGSEWQLVAHSNFNPLNG